MTPEQEIRAAALQAAATVVGPQLAEAVYDEDFDFLEHVNNFRSSVEDYADYIQHGVWPAVLSEEIPLPEEDG